MPDKDIILLVGELKGEFKTLTDATKLNTAEIKQFNQYMYKTIGATEERDKHYRRVKHTAIGSIIISGGTLIKAFLFGHA